jgi:hypothetical protein
MREGLLPIAIGGFLSCLGRGQWFHLTVFFATAEFLRHVIVESGDTNTTRSARQILAPLLVPIPAAVFTGWLLSVNDLSIYGWFLARYLEYLAYSIFLAVLMPVLHAFLKTPVEFPD